MIQRQSLLCADYSEPGAKGLGWTCLTGSGGRRAIN